MDWLLAYLLTGFVLSWLATHVLHVPVRKAWRIELAATVIWPAAIVIGFSQWAADKRRRP